MSKQVLLPSEKGFTSFQKVFDVQIESYKSSLSCNTMVENLPEPRCSKLSFLKYGKHIDYYSFLLLCFSFSFFFSLLLKKISVAKATQKFAAKILMYYKIPSLQQLTSLSLTSSLS